MNKVYVLMSTYNGETFLRRQIDSILNQEGVEVVLWIRDDGSEDSTVQIIQEYQSNYENIVLHQGTNVGYTKSFMWLARNCPSEGNAYYAFSDQDDIWDETKLISAVQKLEALDTQKPLVYYSDLKVVDKEERFIRMANNWEGTIDKYMLAVFIGIRGCTMVFNGTMQKMIAPYEISKISGHDTYIALIAFWLGEVVYDENAYINYRQTGNNLSITGVSKADKLKKNLLYVKKRLSVRKCIHENNAKELISHYGAEYDSQLEDLKLVANYKQNLKNRLRLLFSRKFKNFSPLIILFNDFFIIFGKL